MNRTIIRADTLISHYLSDQRHKGGAYECRPFDLGSGECIVTKHGCNTCHTHHKKHRQKTEILLKPLLPEYEDRYERY